MKIIPSDPLSIIYTQYLREGGAPLPVVQRYAGPARAKTALNLVDDGRNEREIYRAVIEEQPGLLDALFRELMEAMRDVPFDDCGEMIDGLDFLQGLVARAMWKHELPVGGPVATFTKDFDRFDALSERLRLQQLAQRMRFIDRSEEQ